MEYAEEEEAAEAMAHPLASRPGRRSGLPVAVLRAIGAASFHTNSYNDSQPSFIRPRSRKFVSIR